MDKAGKQFVLSIMSRDRIGIVYEVSGPGVVAQSNGKRPGLHDLAEVIKRAAFRVTRCGELVGRQVAAKLGAPFGVVDLSLALTPDVGDSVGEILKLIGVDAIGAPGSTAVVGPLSPSARIANWPPPWIRAA